MQQFSYSLASIHDLEAIFSGEALARALRESSSILVQAFWDGDVGGLPALLHEELRRRAPRALVVGASSSGQIVEGRLRRGGASIIVTCFARASLERVELEAEPGREAEAGAELARRLASLAGAKAVLLLLSPTHIDAAAVLRGLGTLGETIACFGGGAERGLEGQSGVLVAGRVSPRGIVAVAIGGEDVEVEVHDLFEWKPLGPEMEFTEIEGTRIRSIDHRPAFDFFRDNFGVDESDEREIFEFPFLIEREGEIAARNILSIPSEGGVRLIADARKGERARLGYLDDLVREEAVARASEALRDFGPQAIWLYSCICRLSCLQEAVESETMPFQAAAPAAGFFTAGEISSSRGRARLLNSSLVVVSIREGARPAPASAPGPAPSRAASARYSRQLRMTSRLFRFIGSLTERLETANRDLALRNAELDTLLRELQHRIKNSMSLVSSIAGIEASLSESPETRETLGRLGSRIAALASLYELLYASGDIEEIRLSVYLARVVDEAAEGYGADALGISITHRIEDLRLDLKRAIPLGLVVNELVTNCLKYGFPAGRQGKIEVSLAKEGGELALRVEDDGIGLSADPADSSKKKSGFDMVGLLAQQLGARFSAGGEGGAQFEFRMPL